ncbi:hypothetical protein F5X97DRAFT_320485 [Nemania serpens]|nr:hypothetical protein F5X97DRAFT_320485 [Nemania serpens]
MSSRDKSSPGRVLLFDETQERLLRQWKQQQENKSAIASRPQIQAQRPQGPKTQAAELARKRVDSIRHYIRLYLKNDSAALEDFLLHLSEMAYDVRLNTIYDVHVMLRNATESGWPKAEIWMHYPVSPHVVDKLTARAGGLIWEMAAETAGARELPARVWVSWQLCDSGRTDEVDNQWGDGPGHFGRLDLWDCLEKFPLCALDLGWFQKPRVEEIPVDPALLECYKLSQGLPLRWGLPC